MISQVLHKNVIGWNNLEKYTLLKNVRGNVLFTISSVIWNSIHKTGQIKRLVNELNYFDIGN
jgi:hypothetical protein